MTNNIDDFYNSKCVLAIGTNAPEAHPVLAMRVRQVVRGGTKLIVANPMEVDFCRDADLWIRHNVGTDVALLMGLCRIIYDEGLYDKKFVEERCENFEAFKEELKNYPIEWVSKITGVEPELLVRAARMYAENSPATILYAMGICEHSHGTDNVIATGNLAMLTGNVGKPGSGVNPLRGQNNVQGACDMGALPNVFTGYQSTASEDSIKKFELTWDTTLTREPGMKLTTMLPSILEGKIKAMYIMGENPVMTDPDANHVREELGKLDFFVFQDLFLNETAEYAHVILPACSYAEKDGTFTNTERRVQRVRKAIEPIGESKDDCWIVCEIAKRMGAKGFDFENPGKVMEEIAHLTPSYGGITFKRLEEGGLQWPCYSEDHPGTCILHEAVFARPSGKGNFVALKYRGPTQLTDKEYPLMLITGRRLYHYHATMTRKSGVLNTLLHEEECEINPADAEKLGIKQGDMIKVASKQGEVRVRANVSTVMPQGVVHMAFHFADTPTNELISAKPETLDPVTGTPAYKNCPVKISRLAGGGKEQVVSALYRAWREPDFVTELKNDPKGALKDYKLNNEEKAAVLSGDVEKIEAITGRLNDRIRVWLISRSDYEKW